MSLPEGNGKALVEARCQLCHDLGRVAGIKRTKAGWDEVVTNMVTRGASATPEEARTILLTSVPASPPPRERLRGSLRARLMAEGSGHQNCADAAILSFSPSGHARR